MHDRMRKKIVLIGAGSASFTRGLVLDLARSGWDLELGLVDTDAEALAVAEGLSRKVVEATGAAIAVEASVDRRDVLAGATAVICTIGVGGRRAWERDVLIPRKYGIHQPVGDSVMPGGTSRALRMIPAMVAIAEDVLDLCPTALFVNYGNPMAPVCRAVRKATGAPVVGLCHGVFGVERYLAAQLGVDASELTCTAVGMNHLTWFTEVRVGGRDAMDRLREVAAEKIAAVPQATPILMGRANARQDDSTGESSTPAPPPADVEPFSWQLFELFGAFPAVLDRHVTEFFPQFFRTGRYYGQTLGRDAFSFERTIEGGDRGFEKMREAALSDDPLDEEFLRRGGGEQEQAFEILESIRTDARRVYSANLPNVGQVANLPAGAILEGPAAADGSGLHPIAVGSLPSGLVGTLATRLAWVETVVEAAIEGSREKFIQALLLDCAVDSVETAVALADELLAAQAEFLPQFAGREAGA